MAHPAQTDFFKRAFDAFPMHFGPNAENGVIDFGSLNLNGGPHDFIETPKYVGVDLEQGPNVDIACSAELVGLPSLSFDASISSECFEHNPFWKETFMQMCRLTRGGGVVIWTCAGIGRPEHGTTRSDGGVTAPFVVKSGLEYYENISAFTAQGAIAIDRWFDRYFFIENFHDRDTYFVGIRKGAEEIDLQSLTALELISKRIYGTPSKYSLRKFLDQRNLGKMLILYFIFLPYFHRVKRFVTKPKKLSKMKRIAKSGFKLLFKH